MNNRNFLKTTKNLKSVLDITDYLILNDIEYKILDSYDSTCILIYDSIITIRLLFDELRIKEQNIIRLDNFQYIIVV